MIPSASSAATACLVARDDPGGGRLQGGQAQPRQGGGVGVQQLHLQPLALVAERLIGGTVGAEPLRRAVGREVAHQGKITAPDLGIGGILVDAENGERIGHQNGLRWPARLWPRPAAIQRRRDHRLAQFPQQRLRHPGSDRRGAKLLRPVPRPHLPGRTRPRDRAGFSPRLWACRTSSTRSSLRSGRHRGCPGSHPAGHRPAAGRRRPCDGFHSPARRGIVRSGWRCGNPAAARPHWPSAPVRPSRTRTAGPDCPRCGQRSGGTARPGCRARAGAPPRAYSASRSNGIEPHERLRQGLEFGHRPRDGGALAQPRLHAGQQTRNRPLGLAGLRLAERGHDRHDRLAGRRRLAGLRQLAADQRGLGAGEFHQIGFQGGAEPAGRPAAGERHPFAQPRPRPARPCRSAARPGRGRCAAARWGRPPVPIRPPPPAPSRPGPGAWSAPACGHAPPATRSSAGAPWG